jgi:putative component of toxin-antitoxin plasmid stabilization module
MACVSFAWMVATPPERGRIERRRKGQAFASAVVKRRGVSVRHPADPPYEIEFYEDDAGNEPALAFMRSLSGMKKRAIGVAINEVLQYLGPDVAEGNFGRNLGGGLYEFRLDQDAEQILRRSGKKPRPERDRGKILLRLFFHPHGKKLLLLLCGYDKGERPSKAYQQEQIDEARGMLGRWKEREKARVAAARRPGGRPR